MRKLLSDALVVVLVFLGTFALLQTRDDVRRLKALTPNVWTRAAEARWCQQMIELNQGFVCPDMNDYPKTTLEGLK